MFFSAVKLTSASSTEVDSKRQEIKETVEGMKGNAGLTLSFTCSVFHHCLGTSVCSYLRCAIYDCKCRWMQTLGLVLIVVLA